MLSWPALLVRAFLQLENVRLLIHKAALHDPRNDLVLIATRI